MLNMDDQKNKALVAALAQIEKQFGKGSIMKMGEAQIANDLTVVSTGSLGLDIALGVGGLPRGRVVEIYGPESSGKTTLCLQVVAQIQKIGGVAAYIDAENALDPVYAGKLGVQVGDLLISQPDTGEQALEIADMLVRSGGVDIIVVDSVAALGAKARSSSSGSTTASSRSPAPGTRTPARRSGRARTTRASTCASIPRSPKRSKRRSARRSTCPRPSACAPKPTDRAAQSAPGTSAHGRRAVGRRNGASGALAQVDRA